MKCLAPLLRAVGASFLLVSTCAVAAAPDYPAKPIKIVVPYAAGGPTDLLGRLLAQKLAEQLGQSVFVENRAGAGGSVGISVLARSAPDGYTLGVSGLFWAADDTRSMLAMNQSADPRGAVKDLEPIGLVGAGPYTIVTHPSLPADLRGFIAHVRSRPGKVNMGSSGIGSPPHVAGALFNQAAGLDVVHVPYKGASLGLPAVASGEVDYMFDAPGTSKAFAANAAIRILAVTTAQRSELLPDVPTVSEAAIPGFTAITWNGLFAPAGTSPAIVARLSQALQAIAAQPDFKSRLLAANGYVPQRTTPEEFARFIDDEVRKWSGAVESAQVRVRQ